MATKTQLQPATPLPWGALEHQHLRPIEDAAYLFGAGNAYPELVEMVRASVYEARKVWIEASALRDSKAAVEYALKAEALLRKLGEAA